MSTIQECLGLGGIVMASEYRGQERPRSAALEDHRRLVSFLGCILSATVFVGSGALAQVKEKAEGPKSPVQSLDGKGIQ